MAAIAQISSLREWEEEWNVLEEETQNFKQTKFQDYQQKMDEFHAIQKSCVSGVNQQKRKLADFRQSLKQFLKGRLTDEQKAHSHQLQLKMADLERKIKAFEISLPSQAGLFLKCCLGNINVSLHNKKLEYKNDYENFKFKMILISMLFTILDLFVFNYRYAHEIKKLLCLLTTLYIYVHVLCIVLGFPVNLILLKKCLSNKELNLLCRITDALFHALLLWYYSTLTLQEHILIANGSRIKGWWVAHHYVSILLSGLLLIWPDGTVYQLFRKQFFYFSLYLAFVQLLQFRYQSGVLYRLRALGISHSMDITKEGFQSWMWRGLGFVIPFLIVGYVFQLYNAYTLYRLSFHPECTDWQVLALSVVFFTLFAGNMTTLLYVLQQKITKTWRVPEMPCG